MSDRRTLTVWRISDGIAGHQRQADGLLRGLAEQCPVQSVTLQPLPAPALLAAAFKVRPPGLDLPLPDIVLGAGSATHLSVAALARGFNARAVLLMNTRWPRRWFDLLLIPEHDGVAPAADILITQGALNPVRADDAHRGEDGIILLGGPSRHHQWDETNIVGQIRQIVAPQSRPWLITDSRRTPPTTLAALRGLEDSRVRIASHTQFNGKALDAKLAVAAQVWVSADSVSMVYEALSCGAAVGLLEVPARGSSRVQRAMEALLAAGRLTGFKSWAAGTPLERAQAPLDEAGRCAREIHQRWFSTQDTV